MDNTQCASESTVFMLTDRNQSESVGGVINCVANDYRELRSKFSNCGILVFMVASFMVFSLLKNLKKL